MSDKISNIDKEFWKKVKGCWSSHIIIDAEEETINQTIEAVLGRRKKRKRIKSALDFLTDDLEEI